MSSSLFLSIHTCELGLHKATPSNIKDQSYLSNYCRSSIFQAFIAEKTHLNQILADLQLDLEEFG